MMCKVGSEIFTWSAYVTHHKEEVIYDLWHMYSELVHAGRVGLPSHPPWCIPPSLVGWPAHPTLPGAGECVGFD